MRTFPKTRARDASLIAFLRKSISAAWPGLVLIMMLFFVGRAEGMQQAGATQASETASQATAHANSMIENDATSVARSDTGSHAGSAERADTGSSLPEPHRNLIVIGFMGGNVGAGNLVHREAQLIQKLRLGNPSFIRAEIFANRNGDAALRTVLHFLHDDRDGQLSDAEKSAARIVIFGHSWGASETVTLADRLNKLHIPVLLTIQVDSVQKQSQNDEKIPPNVQEAINFYQSEGLLHGRRVIVAEDPAKTKILGNHESSYRQNRVSCAGFPWFARAFMKPHIQIENDPAVWDRIEALILSKVR